MGSTCSIPPSRRIKSGENTPYQIPPFPSSQKLTSKNSFLMTNCSRGKIASKRESILRSHSQKLQKSSSIETNFKKFHRILFNVPLRPTAEISNPEKKSVKNVEKSEKKLFNSWRKVISNELDCLKVYYAGYMTEKLPWKLEYEIKKDLCRTFPVEKYFQNIPGTESCEGQTKLFNVLKAITMHYTNIGYCQGMNFLVGFLLLMNGGNESEAFSFFVKLSTDANFFLIYLYEEKFPLLYFLIFVFKEMSKKKIPEIHKFLQELEFPDEAWLTKWFLSFFLNGFPLHQAERFWEYILNNGIFSVISLTIGIISNLKNYFFQREKIDFMNLINELPQNEFLDIEKCLKEAKKIKISRRNIGKMADEYLKINPKFKKNFALVYFRSFAKRK